MEIEDRIKKGMESFLQGVWNKSKDFDTLRNTILHLSDTEKKSIGCSGDVYETAKRLIEKWQTERREHPHVQALPKSALEHKGLRFNNGKKRFDLVHPWAHEQMVNVLTVGAQKYAERNWERGMAWSNVIASLKRHLNAIESGEDFDPESGELHAAHIACNAHFLTAYYKIYPQGDDRPKGYLNLPKIGLDIDEVLCDWVGDWTEYRGIEKPTSWWFDRGLLDEFNSMKEKGELDKFFLSLKPLIDPKDIPFEPHCYITSRPVDTKVTEEWLAKHGFPARPVFTTSVGSSKVDIAKREGVEIFVDDAFHNFKALNEAGICCFLMDAPHNQRYDVGYKRITNLKQLI